jgi:tRNA(fMet)-specific endonuclease VapC
LRPRFNAEAQALCLSDVVLYELLYGAERSARPAETRQEVERFAARLTVLPFDDDAAAHTADIRAALERKGAVIGPYDLMIAGHARSRGLVVVTGNLREFQRVDGLRAEDWLAEAT